MTQNRTPWLALFACLSLGAGCVGALSEEDPELNEQRQAMVESINGLRSINGLSSTNGLRSINGLSSTNGLRSINGLQTINGLRSINGLTSVRGMSVDCTGKTVGKTCTGEPDGLLSASTGLMSSDEGINTAKYLLRCALPANDSLRIKDYTGGLVTLKGELGLTPGWKDGQCDTVCQEKISACLLAFTNGSGEHIPIEMSAHYKNADGKSGTRDDNVLTIGTGHSELFPKQEAAFYGNLFTDPPQAYYCTEEGPLSFIPLLGNVLTVDVRACGGYVSVLGIGVELFNKCPIKSMGSCREIVLSTEWLLFPHLKCSERDGAKTTCESGVGTGIVGTVAGVLINKSWRYPMTTWVQ